MQIDCHYHALLQEKSGLAFERLELPSGALLKDAIAQLRTNNPMLEPYWERLKYAINDEFATVDAGLKDGDRLDLLPPFGGG